MEMNCFLKVGIFDDVKNWNKCLPQNYLSIVLQVSDNRWLHKEPRAINFLTTMTHNNKGWLQCFYSPCQVADLTPIRHMAALLGDQHNRCHHLIRKYD